MHVAYKLKIYLYNIHLFHILSNKSNKFIYSISISIKQNKNPFIYVYI